MRTVHHRGWAGPPAPTPLPAPAEAARGLAVTDRAVLRDGVPWVPVSGEIHYSRLPRARWRERLRQLRAGGVTVASTYVFWLHHSPAPGVARFDGNLDVGAFLDECADAGLEVALRIGPWVHGEARNGGFPDWVQNLDVRHRSDDPRYLDLVREWFGQLADALGGRAQPGGPVIAVQLENELYDRPEHLRTLKRLAREAGIAAPLWTATAWGGAQLPAGEVLPLFGGYADGFWVDPGEPWHPTFRAHFFPSHDWDDPGVGADVRDAQGFAAASATADLHGFPPATCELGSGMATAYHRRPVLTGRDIAALAHVKIGNGSAWQGYFMYAGGRNPGPGMQETQATGYPNDMPELGYDFHAPIGQSGDPADAYPLLRDQHSFLAAFGHLLGGMTSSLPDDPPTGLDDRTTLRWALRCDGDAGFVVISHHQPHEPVADALGVQLRIVTDAGTTVLPSRPVDIPAGTLARWPVGLTLGGSRLDWATASAVTLLPGGVPTLVLVADAGIPVEVAVDGAVMDVIPGVEPVRVGGFDLLVLPAGEHPWVPDLPSGRRRLLLSEAELAWGGDGTVHARPGGAGVREYDPPSRAWRRIDAGAGGILGRTVTVEPVQDAVPGPADYGFAERRHSAPDAETFDAHAAVFALTVPPEAFDGDAVLDIDWAGDVGQLRCDGIPVDDRFWDGTRWSVALSDAGIEPDAELTLHVLPLAPETTIALPAGAAARLSTASAPLVSVDAVTVRSRGDWTEVPA
ncbi:MULTISPECIES: beta-galactosidase [Microbacterium]|uniref:Glycosyl hydrolases family 35 n=1 Tax=Microbacterium saccharophilum TaxID=1213358 RepID=A0A7Z7D127_9MICO|nr:MULTISPECIES: beta-galactosidase [Microbacterium]SFI47436.1 Glycosyl hydrolases family 35 [Microbacterium saccharophilum]